MAIQHLRRNAVAYLALAVALGTGTAYAAPKIANGSVTTKKLAMNAVTSAKIKNGSVKAIDIRGGSVTSFSIADGSVTANDLATGSVTSTDVQDGTVSSADIQDAVVPQDADILASSTGQNPAATPAAAGLNPFAFTLDRNAKLVIEFFAGELGVDCAGGGQGQIGVYLDGNPRPGTLTDVPASADAGAVQIVTSHFVQAGNHTLTIGEQCAAGAHGPTVAAERVSWQVHLLAR
jgi:hypothetical protein